MGVKLVASSGGSVELVPTNTASNFTVTVPAKTGTMAMDGPAFSAYQSSAQSISANTFTKVDFQTEEFDTNSNFASSRFTPTVAGYYQINAQVYPNTSTTKVLTAIYKNGSAAKNGDNPATNAPCLISALIYCNGSTDYLEVYAYITGTTPQIFASSVYTFFQASMVRGA